MSEIETMLAAAIEAAGAISEIYARGTVARHKADGSPVTEADACAEEIILRHLAPLGLPILAEESVSAGRIPALGERFFCVDPLDGTKEFLKRNGEFTVNIALVERGRPRLGVILAPVTGATYWGTPEGAHTGRLIDGSIRDAQPAHVVTDEPLRIVASRSHGHPALRALCDRMAVAEDVTVGSSLKFGLLATGAAQLYPRFGPTSEWDTAAGQAILEAAGGVVLQLDGSPLTCGHPADDFINPTFVAAASQALAEAAIAEILAIEACDEQV